MRVIFTPFLFALLTVVMYAEPSVYGVDTNSASYKLQKSMQKTISMLQQRVIEQDERIEGLRSVVEGLSASVHKTKSKESTTKVSANTSGASYMKLEAMIEEIKQNYVRKKPDLKQAKTKPVQEKKTSDDNKTAASKSNEELFLEGVRLYSKKKYTEAIERFENTDNKGYKAATSNYYLGEIAYYTKKYDDAIFFFKKSAGLDDKTTYIDTLLLHTAVSLERSGKAAQAKIFYSNIVANYKGKRSATIASERLKKL